MEWLRGQVSLPLRRRDGDAAVVVVVAAGLLTNEVLHGRAVLGHPLERGLLQDHASLLGATAAVDWIGETERISM